MNTLNKRWNVNSPVSKKLLARTMTYSLSHLLDHQEYVVAYEAWLTKDNLNEPDVVVYRKNDMSAIMAIEVCTHDELPEMLVLAKSILNTEKTLEYFYIYDRDAQNWYRIGKSEQVLNVESTSVYKDINLRETIVQN